MQVIVLVRAVRHIGPAFNINVGCIAPGGTGQYLP
jgi:hypothetical protein